MPTKNSPTQRQEITIAIMGATGAGKTTFINLVSSASLKVGQGLQSCTADIQTVGFDLNNMRVNLIDTPGFDDTTLSDTDVLNMMAAHLASSYERGHKLSGVVYIHRISDVRVGGVSARNFRMFRNLCGETSLKNVAIVTNMWGEVKPGVGEARERELATETKFFKPALDKEAKMLRHDATLESALRIVQHLAGKEPEALEIQRELVDQRLDISQTAAGAEVNRELLEQVARYQAQLETLQAELNAAIAAKDGETKEELEAVRNTMQSEVKKAEERAARMQEEYMNVKKELERRIEDMERDARDQKARVIESEREKAELWEQMKQLKGVQATANLAAVVGETHSRKLTELEEEAARLKGRDAANDSRIAGLEQKTQRLGTSVQNLQASASKPTYQEPVKEPPRQQESTGTRSKQNHGDTLIDRVLQVPRRVTGWFGW